MKKHVCVVLIMISCTAASSQLKWIMVDSLFGELPSSFHVYKTTDSLDGKPNIAYYIEAGLKDKKLEFTVDTTYKEG